MSVNLTRRDFLESTMGAVSVIGFSLIEVPGRGRSAGAAQVRTVAEIPVIWMATGSCSGCSVALINSASPTIQELLLGEVLPQKHVSLGFHATIMAGSGEGAMEAMDRVAHEHKGGYVLIVDGATAVADDGLYCGVGEIGGEPITGYDHVRDLGRDAMAVLAVGQCSSFGGIPAAGPNPTDCLSVQEIFEREQIRAPLVCIPGCPPHPDWIVGSIATLLIGGLDGLQLDEHNRPAPFFKNCVHDQCHLRGLFEQGEFAEHFGDQGCLLKLGCKGPITFADCPVRKFNNGTSWCCEAGHPCIGCCHRDFPFDQSMFAPIEPSQMGYPEIFPTADADGKAATDPYIAVGMIGAGGFLAGLGVATAARKLKHQHDGEKKAEEADHESA